MRSLIGNPVGVATEIDGHALHRSLTEREVEQKQQFRPDRSARNVTRINGQRISFGDLARFAWPSKTESHLAHVTRADPRTCRRWLAGDNEPPAEALGVVLAEIMRRFHQRG